MPDEGTKEMQALWVPSTLHPERRVAQPTLIALLRLLRLDPAEEGRALQAAGCCALQDVPTLGTVGGIARMEGPGGEAVVVARVGRASFVGYRLTDDRLDEVEVALNEVTGQLSIETALEGESPRS